MNRDLVRRGDLLFLTHPGSNGLFSGCGVVVGSGNLEHLIGLLLVDRPRPVSPAWLRRVRAQFGDYQLYPMTRSGERGMACQMWIAEESRIYLQKLDEPFAHLMQEALLTLLIYPPAPQFTLSWHKPSHMWHSRFREDEKQESQVRPEKPRRKPLFSLGDIVATPGALAALEEADQLPQEFLHRHVCGDWGALDPHDVQANEDAVRHGDRILSAYVTAKGERLWVITEYDRSVTTLLLPSEY